MLKINLLPIRQLKKRAQAKTQLFSFATLFIFVLLILASVSWIQSTRAKSIQSNIDDLKREKQQYAKTLNQINKLKKEKAELQRKIEIIDKLEQESSLTVHVLDEVATKLNDAGKLWLLSLDQQGGALTLAGVGLDNQTVADFMNSLKSSPYINAVNLSSSSMKKVAGKSLKTFKLSCAVAPPMPAATKENTPVQQKK